MISLRNDGQEPRLGKIGKTVASQVFLRSAKKKPGFFKKPGF
jgi:hypothetical protein